MRVVLVGFNRRLYWIMEDAELELPTVGMLQLRRYVVNVKL
jgi:hypothetical protein